MAAAKNPDNHLKNTSEMTTLQTHVDFFDRDHDGVLWPIDTFLGFRDIGFGYVISFLSMVIIHGAFSWATLPPGPPVKSSPREFIHNIPTLIWSLLPDPFFRIYIANIARAKHGSDSGSYNHQGKFDKSRFQTIFDQFCETEGKDSLSLWEGFHMLIMNRALFDPFGMTGSLFEWGVTYAFLWPADGRCKKEDIKGVIDGSIFITTAERRRAEKGKQEKPADVKGKANADTIPN